MNPDVWGRHGWFFLHSITMGYPDKPTPNDADSFRAFFYMLPNVLPCDVCRKHFADHLRSNNIERALTSKRTLVEWLIQVHNMANRSLGKKELNYDQVIALYTDIYAGKRSVCGSGGVISSGTDYGFMALIVAIALVVGAFGGNYLRRYL